jgi:hypothetical protein
MRLLQKSIDMNRTYTYADYEKWNLKEGERYELIGGVPYMMTGVSRAHAVAGRELITALNTLLKGRSCDLYYAPFDVCLFGMGEQRRYCFGNRYRGL